MGQVIDLAKRRAWLDLKKRVASNEPLQIKIDLPAASAPTSDLALAIAYLFHDPGQ